MRRLSFRGRKPSAFEAFVAREFGLNPTSLEWYDEAMTHASLSADLEEGQNANERLEFLGDAVLGAIVAKQLFVNFPAEDEGPMTQRKSRLVSRKALNQIGQDMGLDEFIRTKMGNGPIPETVVGNALEALIGAIFMDHGYVKAEKAVIRMFDRHQEDSAVAMSLDYKTKIQQWAQQSSKKVEYRLQSEAMVDGQIEYQMQILLDGESAGIGTGTSKKRAEQAAAREASRNIPL